MSTGLVRGIELWDVARMLCVGGIGRRGLLHAGSTTEQMLTLSKSQEKKKNSWKTPGFPARTQLTRPNL
jgi:hypothetical protein